MIWILVGLIVFIPAILIIYMFIKGASAQGEAINNAMHVAMGIKLNEESHSSDSIESIRDELRKEGRND